MAQPTAVCTRVLDSSTTLDWRTTGAPAVELRWRALKRQADLERGFVAVLFGVLLWLEGYQGWRTELCWTAAAIIVLMQVCLFERPNPQADGAREQRVNEQLTWAGLALFLVMIAVTGGVRSPLYPPYLAGVPFAAMYFGSSRQATLFAIGLSAITVVFLGVPVAWTGASVAPSTYWLTVALSLLPLGGLSYNHWTMLGAASREARRERSRAREQLAAQAAARARDLEMLSAKIAHELKNPLSAIKMLVQVCIRSPGHPESQERLEVVEREVRHIEETLRDYLRFSHPLDRLEVESTSLATLTDDVFAVLAGRALEARVKLQRQGDVQAEVDRQRIEEALLNLVANAIEASRGGSIVVAISQSGGEAHLSVRDDGLGMSPGVLAKIGTPFFTTRPQGTGLGVTLARAAFVHHGGRLEYQSAPGAGTTVTGTLPLAGPPMGS